MAHPDLDTLLNELLPFARSMLAEFGEFYPFGASMKADGEIVSVGADTGDEHPRSQDLIDLMVRGFRNEASRDELTACGICLDVRIIPPGEDEKTDAICVRLEHVAGEAVSVFLPYRKGRGGRIAYGEIFASRGEHAVFGEGEVA